MIAYDASTRIFHLRTAHSSYIFGVGDYLQSLYWGAPVDAGDLAPLPGPKEHSSFDPDTGLEREEYSCYNGRSFVEPCLLAHTADSRALFFRYASHQIGEEGDAQTLDVVLVEESLGLTLTLHYRVFADEDILVRSATLTNTGEPLTVERFFAGALTLPPRMEECSLRHLTGNWMGECRINDAPVRTGVFTMQSKRGVSGHHFNPSFALSEQAEEKQGNVWFGMLAYSGNWKISIERTVYGNVRAVAGWNDHDSVRILRSGESMTTPELVFGFTSEGFGGMSRTLHAFERKHYASSGRARRVLYNSWEATAFRVNATEQMALADTAASLGVELFVVDDGWFGERDSDKAGLGDWTPNPRKFPNGLGELIDHVQMLGMDFGIWVEPEAVNPDSDLFRAHPDWIYHLKGVQPMTARNEYILNLSLPQVKAYIKEALAALLSDARITFLKWDMNRAVTDLGGESLEDRALWTKHVDALYEIWAWLRERFPHVELESCAGGGGRSDLGMLRYAHQYWPSDNTDPYERLFIQEGFTQFYAPFTMMCWVTDMPKQPGRKGRCSIPYQFHSAMCGGLGIGSDISRLTQEELAEYRRWIAFYKEIRDTVQFGRLYRLRSPRDGALSAVQYLSKDGDETVVFAFLHSQRFGDALPRLRLCGLREDALYELPDGKRLRGSTLMHLGLSVPLRGDFDSVCLRLRRR